MDFAAATQFENLRDAVVCAAHGSAFGQGVASEYVRSRGADPDMPETFPARWTTVPVGQTMDPGGFFTTASGSVRIRKAQFADGYQPRRGDLVRWVAPEQGDWFEVKDVTHHPLEAEWRLSVGAIESTL